MPTATPSSERVCRRDMTLRASTANDKSRTVEAVIATENRTRVFDMRSFEIIDEILLMDGVEIPRQIPMLENHQRDSLEHHIGSIRNLRVRDGKLSGRLHFADGDDRAERAWQLVRQGHLTDVSSGNASLEAVTIEPGETRTVRGRSFTAAADRPLQVTTRWRPREGSLVSIGADQDAIISARSRNPIMPRKTDTPRRRAETVKRQLAAALIERAGYRDPDAGAFAGMSIERIAERCLAIEGVSPSGTWPVVLEACRTASFADVLEDFGVRLVVEALEANADVDLAGWAQRVSVDRYRNSELHTIDENERLVKRERGSTAAHAESSGVSPARSVKLEDYVRTYRADAQDLSGDRVGAISSALQNLSVAAVRTRSDLVHARLLENPELDDGTDLFHSDHNNAHTLTLDRDNLGTVAAGIRNQQLHGKSLALEPRHLIVAPSLENDARAALHGLQVEGEANLRLWIVPALENGVTHPATGAELSGSSTTWFVAAARRSIAIAHLEGQAGMPSINTFTSEGGDGFWGMSWAVRWALDAVPIDYRGISRGNL